MSFRVGRTFAAALAISLFDPDAALRGTVTPTRGTKIAFTSMRDTNPMIFT